MAHLHLVGHWRLDARKGDGAGSCWGRTTLRQAYLPVAGLQGCREPGAAAENVCLSEVRRVDLAGRMPRAGCCAGAVRCGCDGCHDVTPAAQNVLRCRTQKGVHCRLADT